MQMAPLLFSDFQVKYIITTKHQLDYQTASINNEGEFCSTWQNPQGLGWQCLGVYLPDCSINLGSSLQK